MASSLNQASEVNFSLHLVQSLPKQIRLSDCFLCIQDLNERLRRLQSEKENLQSKMDAEKHIMRTQVRDLMQKHQEELKKVTEKYEHEMSEKQMTSMSSVSVSTSLDLPVDPSINQRLSDLEGIYLFLITSMLLLLACIIQVISCPSPNHTVW